MERVLGLQGLNAAPGCCGDPCDHCCDHWCDHLLSLSLVL